MFIEIIDEGLMSISCRVNDNDLTVPYQWRDIIRYKRARWLLQEQITG